jgi:hypothetical protein
MKSYLLFILLEFACFFVCYGNKLIDTNIWFEGNSKSLSIFEKQRPEDSVNDFIIYNSNIIGDSEIVTEQILGYICPILKKNWEDPVTRNRIILCEENHVINDILFSIDFKSILLGTSFEKNSIINIRDQYSIDFYISMICDEISCEEEDKKYINDKISKKINELKLNNESQFSSSNHFICLGLLKKILDENNIYKPSDFESITTRDIKSAYRSLAIKYHPDKNIGKVEWATDIFKNISLAYEILSDDELRKDHQQFLIGGIKKEKDIIFESEFFKKWNIEIQGNSFSFSFNF